MSRAKAYTPPEPMPPPQAQPSPVKVKPKPTPPNFAAALISAPDLITMAMDKRPAVLGPWMKQGDLGYLFAPRGAGKSWMAMLIGNAIAQGLHLGEWDKGERPRQVDYFDAEMNLADVQERARKLGINSPNFKWLSNEHLFTCGGQGGEHCQYRAPGSTLGHAAR